MGNSKKAARLNRNVELKEWKLNSIYKITSMRKVF